MSRSIIKTKIPRTLIISLMISVLSILLAVFDPTPTRIICAVAMPISTLGDFILADYKPLVSHLPFRGFIAGGCVFGISHVVYIIAFIVKIITHDLSFFGIGAYIGIAIFSLIAFYLAFMCIRMSIKPHMTLFAFAYLLLICLNCTCVFSIATSVRGISMVSAVGVFSFLISDMIIALDVFCNIKLPNRARLIWIFYPIGQILLLIGA